MRTRFLLGVICLPVLGLACGVAKITGDDTTDLREDSESKTSTTESSPPGDFVNDKAFHATLLGIAAEYKRYGRMGDEPPRFAPAMCAASPGPNAQPQLRFSRASIDAPHTRKLYYLYAKNPNLYRARLKTMPVGQTIVKQSWQPVETESSPPPPDSQLPPANPSVPTADSNHDFATNPADGKVYRPGKQTSLFIMIKTDPKTPGTDRGWVYGTVTPDGKQVTSAGRVQSCMACHQSAPRDRMFGLPGGDGGGVGRKR
jgi:Cytochrome P460